MPDPGPIPAVPVTPPAPVVLAPAAEPEFTLPANTQHIVIEDDAPAAPAPVATPAPVVVAAPAPIVAPAPPPTVPLAAVQEERGKRQAAEDRLRQTDPIITALHQHPDLVKALQDRLDGVVPPAPDDTPDLTEIAKDLVLYKPDGSGQLDLDAARRVRDRQLTTTRAVVKQALEDAGVPALRQTVQQRQAADRRSLIERAAEAQGVTRETLTPILDALAANAPELLDQPEVGAIAILLAKGLSVGATAASTSGAPPTPAGPAPPVLAPIVTDGPGARGTAPAELDPLNARLARKHGVSKADWATSAAKFGATPDRHIAMEKED